jgi:small subunit ribosomal protein S4
MLRKHKKFDRPRKPFDIVRIKAENVFVEKYGLKNKREIWKARKKLDGMRNRAKKLVNEDSETQKEFIEKLNRLGYKVENIVEVLALTEEDILKRRLQSIVINKGIATTAKGARQLITHKHVEVDGVRVNIPSYSVSVEEEGKIKLVKKNNKSKPKEFVAEEVVETSTGKDKANDTGQVGGGEIATSENIPKEESEASPMEVAPTQ